MLYNSEPVIINTDALNPPEPSGELWGNRASAYHMYDVPGVPRCSIMVPAFNRLKKTRYCIECILKYTQDVDYELILIDNGSDDGTLEYFQSVPYDKKIIIKITKNIGVGYATAAAIRTFSGKYLAIIPNDVYVTQNWLSNLLKCYESDPRTGLVSPVSSNVSNLQDVDLQFKNFEDMQEKAAAFNVSDPSKWEERMRLIGIISIYSRPFFDIIGITDAAYLHDFIEDDLAIRVRRSGYKLMLCRDTWVCHDHDFRNLEDKDASSFQASLESGRKIYREKYYGIDPWNDINNFEFPLLSPLDTASINEGNISVLAVEALCGTPLLEIRNRLKRRGITDITSYAFTSQAKYYLDLQTVADDVVCDRVDYIQSAYADNMFDIIAFCESVNIYSTPITLLQRLYNFLKPGGVLLAKLRNTDNFKALLRSSGLNSEIYDHDLPAALPLNEVVECMKLFGGQDITVSAEYETISEQDQNTLMKMLRSLKPDANNSDLMRLMINNYILKVIKR